jgi:hypothetical protein
MGQRACLEEEALSALEGGLPRGHLLPEYVAVRLAVFWDVSIDAFDVPVVFKYMEDAYAEYSQGVITVNPRLSWKELHMAIAHELGHHVISQLGPARGFRLNYRGRAKVIEELVVEKGAIATVSNEPIARGQGWRLLALGLYHKWCKVFRDPAPGRIAFYGWHLDSRCPLLY